MARLILHRFLMARPNIASFFNGAPNIASFFCDVASMLHRLLRAPPYYAYFADFCDRALCDRALPLPTRKLTGVGIPWILLSPGVLHRFLMARTNIASFFNGAH
jgi:hypothetical protein